jgi:putative protease
MPDYNARGRGERLDLETMGELIQTARAYGVKSYIAFNILIFDGELEEAIERFRAVYRLSPNAAIVQDVGLALKLKGAFPDLRLHASTQMTVTGEHELQFYSDIGFSRFTLSRELSIEEISVIRKSSQAELEVFVHGSLCISYSGQCMTSSGFGGRSANRGECAQSCRHPYTLVVDGRERKSAGPYLVSPKDLNGSERLDDLIASGVNAIKIEGRLKSPEYVAAACSLYARGGDRTTARLTYSRGDSVGWLSGFDSKHLVDPRFNSHSGIEVGPILSIRGGILAVKNGQAIDIRRGDGILIASNGVLDGGPVFDVRSIGDRMEIGMGREFDLSRFRPGDSLFLTSSARLSRELRKSLTNRANQKRIHIRMLLEGGEGLLPALTIRDDAGRIVTVTGDSPIERARTNSLDEEIAHDVLSALSGTIFILESLDYRIPASLYLSERELKRLRQEACATLFAKRIEPPEMTDQVGTSENRGENALRKSTVKIINNKYQHNNNGHAALGVLLREPSQMYAFEALPREVVNAIYLDFEYGRDYDAAIEYLRERGYRVHVALQRILKPREEGDVERLISKSCDGFLIRNAGSIELLKNRGLELLGDFSLNVTNGLAARYFLERGVSGVTASYDLMIDSGRSVDISRLLSLLTAVSPELIEVPVVYYLPSFHMEYCLYADHLGQGKDHRSCGYPCRRHAIELKDRIGQNHPVLTDAHCRNTMFNGKRKDLSENIEALKGGGAVRFRIEALRENPQDLRKLILEWSERIRDGGAN